MHQTHTDYYSWLQFVEQIVMEMLKCLINQYLTVQNDCSHFCGIVVDIQILNLFNRVRGQIPHIQAAPTVTYVCNEALFNLRWNLCWTCK